MKNYLTTSRSFFIVISFTVLILWIDFSGCAGSKKMKDSFTFIQMTDTQFGMFTENKSFEKETDHFTKAITAANRLKPAFVVVTGDLINRAFDTAQIAEYYRVSSKLNSKIKLYNVPGNHDVGNDPQPTNIDTYHNNFGKDYYSFNYHSMLGIVLNSLYLKSPQLVAKQAKEQEAWLIKTLAEAKNKNYQHIVVFMHHSLFLNDANEPDQYFNIPTNTRKKYIDLLEAAGVKYVFAGHYHRNAFGKSGNLNMVTTGPVGKALGKDSSGFRMITVKGNELTHQYFSLDSIPKKVH